MADARLVIDGVRPPEGAELAEQIGALVGELAEPSQNTESAPDFARMSFSLSPISLIAWSQERRCHWPPTSFIGYFSRRSPCTISRTEAPLAQCVPRLIGLSQDGSWPTQTPF